MTTIETIAHLTELEIGYEYWHGVLGDSQNADELAVYVAFLERRQEVEAARLQLARARLEYQRVITIKNHAVQGTT